MARPFHVESSVAIRPGWFATFSSETRVRTFFGPWGIVRHLSDWELAEADARGEAARLLAHVQREGVALPEDWNAYEQAVAL